MMDKIRSPRVTKEKIDVHTPPQGTKRAIVHQRLYERYLIAKLQRSDLCEDTRFWVSYELRECRRMISVWVRLYPILQKTE